jgi:hypothetical protein
VTPAAWWVADPDPCGPEVLERVRGGRPPNRKLVGRDVLWPCIQ